MRILPFSQTIALVLCGLMTGVLLGDRLGPTGRRRRGVHRRRVLHAANAAARAGEPVQPRDAAQGLDSHASG